MPLAPKAKAGSAKRRGARKPALTDALAEAAWAEADLALAQAMAAFDELEGAAGVGARAEAMALLGQALARAGRRRGLKRLGERGAIEPFDPERHELAAKPARPPATVIVTAAGAARGSELLVKARVEAAPAKKRK